MILLFLRAILFSVPRHLTILAALTAVDNFDFSPLPAWTGTAVSFLFQFLITYFFTEWTLIRRVPRFRDGMLVFFVFLIAGSFYEALVMVYFGDYTWQNVWSNFSWSSLYLVFVYALAVGLAAYRLRRKKIQSSLPEGLEA
ncbi:MAG TPA: hypothetical protein VFQ60_01335 [Patescibacteria group bacterium]|nr:hypothetical protein [Patescibacteria group bacterium]